MVGKLLACTVRLQSAAAYPLEVLSLYRPPCPMPMILYEAVAAHGLLPRGGGGTILNGKDGTQPNLASFEVN